MEGQGSDGGADNGSTVTAVFRKTNIFDSP